MKTKQMQAAVVAVLVAVGVGACGGPNIEPDGPPPRQTSPSEELRAADRDEVLNFVGDLTPASEQGREVSAFATHPQGWVAPPVVGNAGFDTIVRGTAPGWSTPLNDDQCTWLDYIIAWRLGEYGTGAVTTSMPQCGVISETVAVAPGYGAFHVKVRYIMENAGYEGTGVISVGADWLNDAGNIVGQTWGSGFPGETCYQNPDGSYSCPPGQLGVWSTANLFTAKPTSATRFRMRVRHTLNWGGDLTVDWVKVVWAPPPFPTCFTDDSLVGSPRADVISCMGPPCSSTVSGTTEVLSYCYPQCGATTPCDRPGFVKLVDGYVREVTFYTPPS